MILKKQIFFAVTIMLLVATLIVYTPTAKTSLTKEYQQGQFVKIDGKDFVVISNKEFVEILEVTKEDKLKQVSEVHGMESVNDLGVMEIGNKTYLFVLTGQYIIKYDISNPYLPVVELKRNLYDWKTGKYVIGYMLSMSFGDGYIFTAGEKGVRRFNPDNLFVDKIYYFEDARSVASNNKVLAVLTPTKGMIYDIESGNLINEILVENKDNVYMREAFVDVNNNAFFPSDNALFRIDGSSNGLSVYNNPVDQGVTNSYAVDGFESKSVYYTNGFGLTKLNSRLEKVAFYHGGSNINGRNSWTMGVDTSLVNGKIRVATFNNTSVILLDDNLSLLDLYRYTPATTDSIKTPTELGIAINKEYASKGERMQISLYGYWPNENISVGFYEAVDRVTVKSDNRGFARVDLSVSDLKPGWQIISAIGNDSKLSYQKTFEMR